jgi:tetratricopeptide (TPR) repeat protein
MSESEGLSFRKPVAVRLANAIVQHRESDALKLIAKCTREQLNTSVFATAEDSEAMQMRVPLETAICYRPMELLDLDGRSWTSNPIVEALLRAGADPNLAIRFAVAMAMTDEGADMVALLLAWGGDANMPSPFGGNESLVRFAVIENAVDCVSLLLAAGGEVPELDPLVDIFGNPVDVSISCLAALGAPNAARKELELICFAQLRGRMAEICIALQDLELPAPLLIDIATFACDEPAFVPFHKVWNLVTAVRHYHQRHAPSSSSSSSSSSLFRKLRNRFGRNSARDVNVFKLPAVLAARGERVRERTALTEALTNFDGDVGVMEKALAARRLLGAGHPSTLHTQIVCAVKLCDADQFARAKELFDELLASPVAPDSELMALVRICLGQALMRSLGDVANAMAFVERAIDDLALLKQAHAELTRERLLAIAAQLPPVQAERLLEHMLARLGRDEATLRNLCAVVHERGDFERAAHLCGEVLDAVRAWHANDLVRDDDHEDVLCASARLAHAIMLQTRPDHERARLLLTYVVAAKTRKGESETLNFTIVVEQLASLLHYVGDDLPQACALFEEIVATRSKKLSAADPVVQEYLRVGKMKLAVALRDAGDAAAAKLLLLEALAAYRAAADSCVPPVLPGLLGDVHRRLGELAEARALLAPLADGGSGGGDGGGGNSATEKVQLTARHFFALLLRDEGALDESRAISEAVIASEATAHGDETREALGYRFELANTLAKMGERDAARAQLGAVVDAMVRVLGPKHFRTREARKRLKKLKRTENDQV